MNHLNLGYALISLSDKTGATEFAKSLSELGINILSTGGTYKLLQQHNIAAIAISEHTNYPEIMGGRVKSLHPKIHGGILARRDLDKQVMQEHNIAAIDIVAVNLYPFADTIAQENCTHAQAIEQIDIGGPTLVRAAAKNYKDVIVLTDPNDYALVIQQLHSNQTVDLATREYLASKAFSLVAAYDISIANYFNSLKQEQDKLPKQIFLNLKHDKSLPYGENPHQSAAVYTHSTTNQIFNPCKAIQLQGKDLSFNNINDANCAFLCVNKFKQAACTIVKHANPCGVATADTILQAYQRAYATDSTSAFGGVIAFNQQIDQQTIEAIINQQFVELIIAPSISKQAAQILANKRPKVRLLVYPDPIIADTSLSLNSLAGSHYLVQQQDMSLNDQMQCVTTRTPSDTQLLDLQFAWKVAAMVKSNAIVYVKEQQTTGIGAGQMSRIDSAKIAVIKAQEAKLDIQGSAMASDAFFPFRDSVDTAAIAGVSAIVQPGGSIRDDEVIAAANEHNITMMFTGKRHFRH
jgi:phosphoribosylaminoimidazolecarboxamide formyltransferase / IMP cyclohydrolase